MARSYRDLLVWQKAKTLAVHLYRETESFPKTETYGLSSQLRRASVAVCPTSLKGKAGSRAAIFCTF